MPTPPPQTTNAYPPSGKWFTWQRVFHALLAFLGILSASFGIKGFLLTSHIIDGGVVGISMLVAHVTGLSLPLLLVIFNAVFLAVGWRLFGTRFVIKSALAITGFAMVLAWVPFPAITPDKLLTAVFGGFFIGMGIGLTMRSGAVLDGTEIAALLFSRIHPLIRVGDAILMFNVVIFSVAAMVLGIEPALYSMLTYLSASKTIEFILHGVEEYTAITIISPRSNAIGQALTDNLGLGVTVYRGRGGMQGHDQDILFCVVTRLEIAAIKTLVNECDPSAFVVVNPLADVEGGMVRRAGIKGKF